MAKVSTDEFPYTLDYVKELLSLDDTLLSQHISTLSIQPKRDPQNGLLILTHRDVEMLKRNLEVQDRSSSLQPLLEKAPSSTQHPLEQEKKPRPISQHGQQKLSARSEDLPPERLPLKVAPNSMTASGENLEMIVEAVSQAKEGILKDLSRLLDDKLAGLDEVVVELIRCKSENDALRQRLQDTQVETEKLQHELSRFKPVQFGFYRKINA